MYVSVSLVGSKLIMYFRIGARHPSTKRRPRQWQTALAKRGQQWSLMIVTATPVHYQRRMCRLPTRVRDKGPCVATTVS